MVRYFLIFYVCIESYDLFLFQAVLAQCVVYLARAPKSVEVYKALSKAKQCVKDNVGPLPSVSLIYFLVV